MPCRVSDAHLTNCSACLAGYNAVIADGAGNLVDVSPQPDPCPDGTIHFMADTRVGFDDASTPLRQPAVLQMEHGIQGTGTNAFRWCVAADTDGELGQLVVIPLPFPADTPDNGEDLCRRDSRAVPSRAHS